MKYTTYSIGDRAITVSFGDEMNKEINERIHVLQLHLTKNRKKHWLDIIPAFATLTVVYDPFQIDQVFKSSFEFVKKELDEAIQTCNWNDVQPGRQIELPVCYDEEFALDGHPITTNNKITMEDLVRLHTGPIYHVFMIGFLPGFAYMGPVNKKIFMPRLSKPRTFIPAGSVGIAGFQTGVYPLDSPGGWNIIGRTPVKLFDPENTQQPIWIRAGDQVRFVSISRDEFDKLSGA